MIRAWTKVQKIENCFVCSLFLCRGCHMLNQQPTVRRHKFNLLMSHALWERSVHTVSPDNVALTLWLIARWGIRTKNAHICAKSFVKLPEQANGMSSIDGVTMTIRTTEAAQWTKTWCLPADDNLYWSEAPNILEIHSKGKSQPLHLVFFFIIPLLCLILMISYNSLLQGQNE